MIWIAFAAMVAVALALLLVPLLKPRAAAEAARVEYDLAVYKDQLGEIDRDIERGLLTPEQAEAARTEIQRRMLAAAEADKAKGKAAAKAGGSKALAAVIAVLVPLGAFGFYAMLGQPGLPDQPMSARAGKIAEMRQQVASVENMVKALAERLKANPNDGKGWAMLGRSYRVLGEPDKAMEAYRKAIELSPGDVQPRLEYGAMLIDQSSGPTLTPEFVILMREVLAIDPDQADALYFMGVAEAQIGNPAKAREMWTRLLKRLPADSEERAEIVKLIDGLK